MPTYSFKPFLLINIDADIYPVELKHENVIIQWYKHHIQLLCDNIFGNIQIKDIYFHNGRIYLESDEVIDELVLEKLIDPDILGRHPIIFDGITCYVVGKNPIMTTKKNLLFSEHRWKLKDWIPIHEIDWKSLSANPRACYLLENNLREVNWQNLSANPSAMSIIEKNKEKICWDYLSMNRNAIHLLKQNPDKIDFFFFSENDHPDVLQYLIDHQIEITEFINQPFAISYVEEHLDEIFDKLNWPLLNYNTDPKAISILEKYPQKINWEKLSSNESAIHLLEKNLRGIEFDSNGNPFQGRCKIDWDGISCNPDAYDIIVQNLNKINWTWISSNTNPQILSLLKNRVDKIHWLNLSENPNAIFLLEEHVDNIHWEALSTNHNASHILEKNIDKIVWQYFSENESMFELDYDFLKERMDIIRMELMAKAWHPDRFQDWCISVDEFST